MFLPKPEGGDWTPSLVMEDVQVLVETAGLGNLPNVTQPEREKGYDTSIESLR